MPKSFLFKENEWYYLTHNCEDKGVHAFPKGYWFEDVHDSATGFRTRLL